MTKKWRFEHKIYADLYNQITKLIVNGDWDSKLRVYVHTAVVRCIQRFGTSKSAPLYSIFYGLSKDICVDQRILKTLEGLCCAWQNWTFISHKIAYRVPPFQMIYNRKSWTITADGNRPKWRKHRLNWPLLLNGT